MADSCRRNSKRARNPIWPCGVDAICSPEQSMAADGGSMGGPRPGGRKYLGGGIAKLSKKKGPAYIRRRESKWPISGYPEVDGVCRCARLRCDNRNHDYDAAGRIRTRSAVQSRWPVACNRRSTIRDLGCEALGSNSDHL